MATHKVDWSSIPWFTVRPGVERKAFSGEGATLALHRLHPGHELKPHDHPYEQIVHVVEGDMNFYVGDEVHRLGPGGCLVIPPNVRHYGEVVGDKPAINLDVFTPRRPEYA